VTGEARNDVTPVTGEGRNDVTVHLSQVKLTMMLHFVTGEAKNDVTPVIVEEHGHDGRKSGKRKHRRKDSTAVDCRQDSLWIVLSELCEFLLESLALYMQHVYASHVIRAVLQVLSAQPIDDVILHGKQRGIRQQQTAGHSQYYTTYLLYTLWSVKMCKSMFDCNSGLLTDSHNKCNKTAVCTNGDMQLVTRRKQQKL